ncbi:MAG: hypothetical protein IJA65_02650 [Acholeplasmatales bacterium]|nr:hypothetical protein [Acholeplasmatales bacterium]
MKTKYPIVLVHGIALKDFMYFKAFGHIEDSLKKEGLSVYTADIDSFGTVENNALQLRRYILDVLEKEKTEKVNIIAHSKGGLDSKYMINNLGMEDMVASLTTLCTPHKGSEIASWIMKLPKFSTKLLAFSLDTFYSLLGDRNPDSFEVCKQLQRNKELEDEKVSDKVYCQSYSTVQKKAFDDIVTGIPMQFFKWVEKTDSDGLVSPESAEFGNYKGSLDDSISHTEMVDFMTDRKTKEKIIEFYIKLCEELNDLGY